MKDKERIEKRVKKIMADAMLTKINLKTSKMNHLNVAKTGLITYCCDTIWLCGQVLGLLKKTK